MDKKQVSDQSEPNSAESNDWIGQSSATYDQAEQARVAVKLLLNQGFTAEQVFVLCTDAKRSEAFRSRLMPAGAAQLNSAPSVVGGAGAAIGASLLGGLGLATGGVAAAAGAAVGAATGLGLGVLLGNATYSDTQTKRLVESYSQDLDKGLIVVHVLIGQDGPDRATADKLLAEAATGVV